MPAKTSSKPKPVPANDGALPKVFALGFGSLLALALLKFGDPCIFDPLVTWPADIFEWIFNHWPVRIGYWMLGGLALVGWFVAKGFRKNYGTREQSETPRVVSCRGRRWLLLLPLAWFGWQLISAAQTVDAELTRLTVLHFGSCLACYYLGYYCLRGRGSNLYFWLPLVIGMLIVIQQGIEQRFGGLEETRKYFFTYIYHTLQSVPAEYLKKIQSDRIFSTLFYPNTLAGAMLLVLPVTLAAGWKATSRLTFPTRCVLVGAYLAGALGCLYWSGSKGGWLLALLGGLITLLHLRFALRLKLCLVLAILVCGVGGFFWKYSGFFQKGATSVVARFDYWDAAVKTMAAKPLTGAGPGTFGITYKQIKKPESEMARLAHNDYLQQASDSGVPGLLLFATWVVWLLWATYPKREPACWPLRFACWLGLLLFALQSGMEFGLYIPAIAWPAFALSGWLLTGINTHGSLREMQKGQINVR